ncbi:uncharacterized protein LOC128035247 isoform X2 [Gossypium raimondii]|uniref:uncharacterized protein LOC128035247 isoform X2 n=1 Tax=Gossypium raimondii TaxID=29730 RepID=UPI00227A7A02|nr:uncharacterized protein LOC128035247 isoform X2 [Gossypium raimondii]
MAATLLFSTSKPLHYYTELSIAVPVRSIPSQFLNISHDDKSHNEAQITGFWIDLFKEAIAVMPINTTYKLVPFYGSDDQLFDTSSQDFCCSHWPMVGPDPGCFFNLYTKLYFHDNNKLRHRVIILLGYRKS